MPRLPVNSGVLPIASLLRKYVFPLLGCDEHQNYFVRGTGFLVEYDNDVFLISAKHVFDQNRCAGPVYVAFECNRMWVVKGVVGQPKIPPDALNSDTYDVIAVLLSEDFPKPPYIDYQNDKKIIDIKAFDITHFKSRPLPRKNKAYWVLGFPITKNKIPQSNKLIEHHLYAYGGTGAPSERYEALNLDERSNILFSFDPKKGVGVGNLGPGVQFPKPTGMSGGPIVEYHPNFKDTQLSTFFVNGVGIQTIKSKNLMLAVDIYRIIHLIRDLRVGIGKSPSKS